MNRPPPTGGGQNPSPGGGARVLQTYSGTVTSFTAGLGAELRRRIERAGGGDYPPLYPAVILSASVAVTVVSVAQRYPFDQLGWVIAALAFACGTLVLDLSLPPSSFVCFTVLASTLCFLMVPVPNDAAPLQLILSAAIGAAMYSLRIGIRVAVLCIALVVVFGIFGGLESPGPVRTRRRLRLVDRLHGPDPETPLRQSRPGPA